MMSVMWGKRNSIITAHHHPDSAWRCNDTDVSGKWRQCFSARISVEILSRQVNIANVSPRAHE